MAVQLVERVVSVTLTALNVFVATVAQELTLHVVASILRTAFTVCWHLYHRLLELLLLECSLE